MIFKKLFFWFYRKNRIVYLVYCALALVVLLPLFKSGYVFAMDMVFTPHMRWPAQFNLPSVFLYLLNLILPSQVIQKILLFLILFLAGTGMHKLILAKSQLPKYFAGIFYIFNPFVYSRFLFGQLWQLMAYALMPFVVKSLFNFFNEFNFKNALKIGLWFAFIGFISPHFIGFEFLFLAIVFLAYIWKNRKSPKKIFKMVKYSILVVMIFLILSSWWVATYLDKSSPRGQYVQAIIGEKDFEAFQTTRDAKYGILWNVAAMYGFWGDRMGQYVVPKDTMPYWFPLFLIIFSLVIFGAICTFKKNRFIAGIFMVTAVMAFIFSVGIAYPPFAPIIKFLNKNLFIFRGFRDSQKFTALLVLTYAYFGAMGINKILGSLQGKKLKNWKPVLAALFIALPILYSPLMVWGFRGQLHASHYPQSWFEANKILNQDKDDFKVLFFPWHQYMSFGFVRNKVLGNPAPRFFDKETIAGDNMEIGEIYTHSQRPVSKLVENKVLAKRDKIDNLGKMLISFNIKYVLLAKEADWDEYGFLDQQKDLEMIYESEELKIYLNKSWK